MRSKILSYIQKNFPLTPRPFKKIADDLGLTEDEVIKIVSYEKEANVIRQISAIFDTKRLGYESTLAAFVIDKEDINEAASVINSHPGVSHNYERDHDFNIWFTLAVPPDSKLGLKKTLELLAKLAKAKDFIMLPTIKMFKISVKLDVEGSGSKKEKVQKTRYKNIKLNKLHQKIIRYAQEDIEIVSTPFLKMVEKIGIDYDTFFDNLKELLESGVMRRYACILNHRRAGFNANAMVAWDIDEAKAETMGKKAAEFYAVSHCYLRPKYPNWPYNLFTMCHGKTEDETNSVIKAISEEIEYKSYRALYSTKEFKKVRIKYFTDDITKWEDRYI